MVIVDDGSIDGTRDIIANYSDPRIVHLAQDHLGPLRLADTYNRALSHARGDYVAILEGDDKWPEF